MYQIDAYTPSDPEGCPANTYTTMDPGKIPEQVENLLRATSGISQVVITNLTQQAGADAWAPMDLDVSPTS